MATRTLSINNRFVGYPGNTDLRDLIGIFPLIHVTTETEIKLVLVQKELTGR